MIFSLSDVLWKHVRGVLHDSDRKSIDLYTKHTEDNQSYDDVRRVLVEVSIFVNVIYRERCIIIMFSILTFSYMV